MMILNKKKNKKPYILYIDKDEKYQYLVNESFKTTHKLKLLSSEDSAIFEIKNVAGRIDAIIISIDNFDYHKIINEFFSIKKVLPNIIFMTSKSDFFVLQKLMVIYSAKNYLIKPFTKSGVIDCLKRTTIIDELPSKRLIENDKRLFDSFYDHLIKQDVSTFDISRVEIEPIDKQLKKLNKLVQKGNLIEEYEKENEKNILFFDDEKESFNFYKQFVKKQAFNSIFINNINSVKEIVKEIGVDLIIIEINELEDKKISCLKSLIESMHNSPDILVINSINIDEGEINFMNSGVRVLLQKPLTNKKMIQLINEVLDYRKIRKILKKQLELVA